MNKPRLSTKGFKNVSRGVYRPVNPSKYIGDPSNIIYRSGLELSCFKFLDSNVNVLKWGSEIIEIKYYDSTTGKKRTYFVDLYFESVTPDGRTDRVLVEVKPSSQVVPPKEKTRNYDAAMAEYVKNTCKWNQARSWARSNGARFEIITEREIG